MAGSDSAQTTGKHAEELRILQVNTHDHGGGAPKVMQDLHAEYLARGIDAWIAVGHMSGTDRRTLYIDNDPARSRWTGAMNRAAEAIAGTQANAGPARRLTSNSLSILGDPARYRDILGGVEDVGFPATAGLLELPPARPDVLHFHNLHGYYFDLRQLPELTASVPSIITMHDAWLLTGHCAHPFDCPRWRTGCGECPDLDIYVPIRKDASARNRQFKRDVIQNSGIGLAVPSRWLMGMIEDSGLAGSRNEVRLIPNGVDTTLFHPADMQAARASLGLPPDRPILLVASQHLGANPFKDYQTFLDALPLLPKELAEKVLVVALGADRASQVPERVEVLSVPYVSDQTEVARYYQAADVYVHPSLADNLPLTVIEASACGIPVIATAVGGIPEIVADGETGLLVPPREPRALAEAIASLLDDDQRRAALAEAGARTVRERFTLDAQADAYIAWYEELRSTRTFTGESG